MLPLGFVCHCSPFLLLFILCIVWISTIGTEINIRTDYCDSPSFKSMDFHLHNRMKKKNELFSNGKKDEKKNSRQTEPKSNINKWICWGESTYSLKKCSSESKKKLPLRYELVALYIAAKFVEKVSFYLYSINVLKKNERAIECAPATQTLIQPIVVIRTRMNHTTSESTTVNFCNFYCVYRTLEHDKNRQ